MIDSKIKIDRADLIALGQLILRFGFVLAFIAFIFAAVGDYKTNKQRSQRVEQELLLFKETIALHLSTFDYKAASSIATVFKSQQYIKDLFIIDRFGFFVYGRKDSYDSIKATPGQDQGSINTNRNLIQKLKSETHFYDYPIMEVKVFDEDNFINLGKLTVVVKHASLLSMLLGAFAKGVLAFVLVLISGYSIAWFYFRHYVQTPVDQVLNAMDKTIQTGEFVKANYKGSTTLGELSNKFNAMQDRFSHIRENSALFLKQRNEFARELKETFESLQEKEQKYNVEIQSIGRVLHSIDQSMSIFDEQHRLIHSNIGSSSTECIICLLSEPIFDVNEAMEKIAHFDVKARILSEYETLEKNNKKMK